jgi:hypothetical protein
VSDTPLPPEALIPVEEDGWYIETEDGPMWVPDDCHEGEDEG